MRIQNKKKVSENKRALRRIVLISMISGVAIIALFYAVEMFHIRNRALETLCDYMKETWLMKEGESDKPTPEIFDLGTDEIGEEYLTDIEQNMLSYYIKNREDIPFNKVQHFRYQNKEVYYYAKAGGISGEADNDALLIYTDVSFTTNTVRTAASILIIVVVAIGIFLCFVSHQTIRMLDKKDKSIKDFFANASHELKTPLMAIRGYVDGWRGGIVPQEKAYVVIDKEIVRMTALINDILEYSKLDGGIVEPHLAENDVREILYDAAGVIEADAGQKGITLTLDLPEPMTLSCDEDMLFSAFSNILTNSVRYAVSDIQISAFRKKEGRFHIFIMNDGILISNEDASHIFERFYTGNGGQTGIGMALCYKYITLHGGTIGVSVKEGRTIFEIEI